MITRVEISGFKTFTDFTVDLAPLSVIAGANASGKSNFLDALRVIQGLATGKTLNETIKGRGNAASLFTKYGPNSSAGSIRLAVEILIPLTFLKGRDVINLDCNRFRYELEILNDLDDNQYYLIGHEKLSKIGLNQEKWVMAYLSEKHRSTFVRQPATPGGFLWSSVVLIDDVLKNKQSHSSFGRENDRTYLSDFSNSSDVHLAAIRQYFENQFLITLDASENFSNFEENKKTNNLILRELKDLSTHHPDDLKLLSLRVRQIAKSIDRIEVEVDKFDRVTLIATDRNCAPYLSSSLSEGTLRTIALTTLLYSKAPQRTIMIEEPENGIDPRVLDKTVALLSDLATDFLENDQPLIQVICTTHSPALLEMIVEKESTTQAKAFLTTLEGEVVDTGTDKVLINSTRISSIVRNITAPIAESRPERFTLHQAKAYMRYGHPNVLTDA